MDDLMGHEDSGAPESPRGPGARQARPSLWFVCKDGQVSGPYPDRVIASFVVLGRLEPGHEISQDGETWSRIAEYPHLLPKGLLDPQDPLAREELLHQQLREDERVGGRRRREQWLESSNEKRHEERRAPENGTLRMTRRLRLEQIRKGRERRETPSRGLLWALIFTPLLALAALILTAALDRVSESRTAPPDCSAAAATGIDWSHCDLSGLDLRRSRLDDAILRNTQFRATNLHSSSLHRADLSFADLRSANLDRSQLDGAVLRGANLAGTSLIGADLSGADLRHADLRGARLSGADLAGARLDRTIWVDGHRCGDGSVGTCR